MPPVFELVSNMFAHHWPSAVNHSLLCGLSAVGAFVAPLKDGPCVPTSPAAALAVVAPAKTPSAPAVS